VHQKNNSKNYFEITGTVIRFNGDEDIYDNEEGAACAMGCNPDETDLPHDQAPEYHSCGYLSVPFDRRHSSITCSSGDTSYLERRGSAFEMGLPPPPCCSTSGKRKLPPDEEQWDFYYPVDIQVRLSKDIKI